MRRDMSAAFEEFVVFGGWIFILGAYMQYGYINREADGLKQTVKPTFG